MPCRRRYQKLEQSNHEKDIQVASLGSLANEVCVIYGLKPNAKLLKAAEGPEGSVKPEEVKYSMDQLYALRTTALYRSCHRRAGPGHDAQCDPEPSGPAQPLLPHCGPSWVRSPEPSASASIHSTGKARSTPASTFLRTTGRRLLAPADGVVTYADFYNGYGRMIQIDHGNGVTTRYGHLSGFAIADGQTVHKGQVIGYVGLSGRSTGPHLHYEVRIHDTPVNPHKFLRATFAQLGTGHGA